MKTAALKAVFIDLRSFNGTMRALGVESVSFKELLRIIRYEIGSCTELYRPPLVTAQMETEGNRSFHEKLRHFGYEVIPITSRDQEDDRIIIKAIQELDADVVKEIVLLSSDADYVNVLRRKQQEGVTNIYIMSARVQGINDTPSIGGVLEDAFARDEFHFYDLAPISNELRYTKLPPPGAPATNGNGVHEPADETAEAPRFVVDLSDARLTVDLINTVMVELPHRFPGIKVRME